MSSGQQQQRFDWGGFAHRVLTGTPSSPPIPKSSTPYSPSYSSSPNSNSTSSSPIAPSSARIHPHIQIFASSLSSNTTSATPTSSPTPPASVTSSSLTSQSMTHPPAALTAPATHSPVFSTLSSHYNTAMRSLKSRKQDIFIDFFAGGVAGAVSRTAVAPLERLKIMFMVSGDRLKNVSVLEALKMLSKEEGFRGFFRGNGANVVRIFPFSAIQLSSYPIFKSMFTDNDKVPITPFGRFWCGVFSGVLATFFTYPLDFIRCRLSMQSSSQMVYKGVVDGLMKVAREEGFLRLYTGLVPTLVGIVPYAGIQLSVYDLTKDLMLKLRGNTKGDQLDFFVSGAWAGMVAQTAAFPIELLRRRMQVRGFEIASVDSKASHTAAKVGFIQEAKNVVQMYGIRGLYRGLIPNYLKIIPAAGVHFLVFEQMKLLTSSQLKG